MLIQPNMTKFLSSRFSLKYNDGDETLHSRIKTRRLVGFIPPCIMLLFYPLLFSFLTSTVAISQPNAPYLSILGFSQLYSGEWYRMLPTVIKTLHQVYTLLIHITES